MFKVRNKSDKMFYCIVCLFWKYRQYAHYTTYIKQNTLFKHYGWNRTGM